MSLNSINTNTGAMVALQSLNMTNASLNMAQKRGLNRPEGRRRQG